MDIELNLDFWPKQAMAFETDATELLFGGASRGGKSHFARVALIVWCLDIANLMCTLIRKKNQDILDNHVYGPNGFSDLLAPLIAIGLAKVTQEAVSFYNGSRITFKHCQDERQFGTAQGIASHVLFVDEATQISENLIRTFRAWCTMPEEMKAKLPEKYKGRFPRIIYTANPIGESVGFFRRHFVKARAPYTMDPVDGFIRQYIPSRVQDNRSEDAAAAKGRLTGLLDAATAQALIEGDWDAPVGDFFPEWDEKNITDSFTPPKWWQRWRSFDWGNTEPFAAYWLCLSDGEQFEDEHGSLRRFPRGAIIVYKEWYGCDPAEPSKGIGLSNKEIARGILSRSEPKFENVTTLTDSLPFQRRGSEFLMSEEFGNEGCYLTQAATQRPQGWAEMRSYIKGIYLTPEDKERTPLLYVTTDCPYAIDYIPALPRHPLKSNDAAEYGESTHSCDAIRYGIFGRHRVVDKAQETFDPKKIWNPKLGNIPTFDECLKIINKSKESKSNW